MPICWHANQCACSRKTNNFLEESYKTKNQRLTLTSVHHIQSLPPKLVLIRCEIEVRLSGVPFQNI